MNHEPLFEVLTEIIEGICHRHLDDLRIDIDDLRGVHTMTVIPHAADYPRLVGKHGGQINAMLYLVNKASVRTGRRIALALKEGFVGDREPLEAFCYNPAFDVIAFMDRLARLSNAVSGDSRIFTLTQSGDTMVVTTPCDRSNGDETFLSAIEAVLKPYCFGSGRKLQLKPHFINHQPPEIHASEKLH